MLCLGAKLPLISDDRQKLVLLNDACNKLFEQLGYSMSHYPGTSMNVESLFVENLVSTPKLRRLNSQLSLSKNYALISTARPKFTSGTHRLSP
jgi:hypothetical protein